MVSEMEKKEKERKKLAFWLSSLADTREWIARESEWYVVTYLNCTYKSKDKGIGQVCINVAGRYKKKW